jgi:Arc/MetJ-type ribon-helix-helix transcriptional regulator
LPARKLERRGAAAACREGRSKRSELASLAGKAVSEKSNFGALPARLLSSDPSAHAEHRMRALVSSGNFGAADAEVVSTALELLERRYDARKAASQGSHQPDDGGAHSQGLERELEASARGAVQTAESATPVVGQDEFGTAPIQNVDIAPQTLVEVELAAADDALDAGVVAAEISVPPSNEAVRVDGSSLHAAEEVSSELFLDAIIALAMGQKCIEGVRRVAAPTAKILLHVLSPVPSDSWVRGVLGRFAQARGRGPTGPRCESEAELVCKRELGCSSGALSVFGARTRLETTLRGSRGASSASYGLEKRAYGPEVPFHCNFGRELPQRADRDDENMGLAVVGPLADDFEVVWRWSHHLPTTLKSFGGGRTTCRRL